MQPKTYNFELEQSPEVFFAQEAYRRFGVKVLDKNFPDGKFVFVEDELPGIILPTEVTEGIGFDTLFRPTFEYKGIKNFVTFILRPFPFDERIRSYIHFDSEPDISKDINLSGELEYKLAFLKELLKQEFIKNLCPGNQKNIVSRFLDSIEISEEDAIELETAEILEQIEQIYDYDYSQNPIVSTHNVVGAKVNRNYKFKGSEISRFRIPFITRVDGGEPFSVSFEYNNGTYEIAGQLSKQYSKEDQIFLAMKYLIPEFIKNGVPKSMIFECLNVAFQDQAVSVER